ncbi:MULTISPECIES: SIMPL domain-containing protein [Bacteria]|uniref:SIMPL domain-containing protein n=1 Tax=Bacteria TaxID=2 RepID=UPI003C7D4E3E
MSSEVTITVRGEHETRVVAERAVVRLSVADEGDEREKVVSRALALAEPIREGLASRAEAGSVTEWSSTRLSVRAERPWNSEGRRLAVVYTASVDFAATFADLSELSLWATEVALGEGVSLESTEWRLTPETRARVEREVAAEAIGAAVARATAYGEALGRQAVEAVEIADVGLISALEPRAKGGGLRTVAFAAPMADTAAMAFHPQDIVVSATVEGRFVAR